MPRLAILSTAELKYFTFYNRFPSIVRNFQPIGCKTTAALTELDRNADCAYFTAADKLLETAPP